MAKPTQPTPRPKMGVINIAGTYILLPMSKALDVFSILDEVVFLDNTWNDAKPYKYSISKSKATLTHISEESLQLMDAEATLKEE